ncbi:MAG: type II toxin-antitoxin system PemK/MazF family toxin [Fimbriimonas sp.]|nr:type II toxin-antitoxin system PemK/MazF family toxin [Fimbriimonas sp.]
MGKPLAGDVVIVPFPFSDLTQTKRRPALVLASLDGDDLILCMITSRNVRDRYAMQLDDPDFVTGGLPVPSNIRPSRLFTADAGIVTSVVGRISSKKLQETLVSVANLLAGGS